MCHDLYRRRDTFTIEPRDVDVASLGLLLLASTSNENLWTLYARCLNKFIIIDECFARMIDSSFSLLDSAIMEARTETYPHS